MKKFVYPFLFLLVFIFMTNAKNIFASGMEKESLQTYLSNEINSLDRVIQNTEEGSAIISNPEDEEEGYFFRRFWLRVRPKVERDIPGLAGFAVIPEVELLWERELPSSWETFKKNK